MGMYGLTGGIACGKSTVAAMFAELPEVKVINTDSLARRIMNDPHVSRDIGRFCLGQGLIVLGTGCTLDYSKLKEAFFKDLRIKAYVEALVHPLVWKAVDEQVTTKPETIWIVESAIIYETKSEERFEDIIAVVCEPNLQRARMLARGYSMEDIQARLGSQLPAAVKALAARYLITTDRSLVDTKNQVAEAYNHLIM